MGGDFLRVFADHEEVALFVGGLVGGDGFEVVQAVFVFHLRAFGNVFKFTLEFVRGVGHEPDVVCSILFDDEGVFVGVLIYTCGGYSLVKSLVGVKQYGNQAVDGLLAFLSLYGSA